MRENKNIERLFQEKFKQFEATPPPLAWQNIQAQLQTKKKKRRVFPLWLRNSGIAASILLSGLIGYQIKSNNIENNSFKNNVVITEKEEVIPVEEATKIATSSVEKNNSVTAKNEIIVSKSKSEKEVPKIENVITPNNNTNYLDANDKFSNVIVQNTKNATENVNIGNQKIDISDKNSNSKSLVQSDKDDNEIVVQNNSIGTKNDAISDKNSNSQILVQSDKNNNEIAVENNNIGNQKNDILDKNTNSEVIVQSDKDNNEIVVENNNIGTKNDAISDKNSNSEVLFQSDKDNNEIVVQNNNIGNQKINISDKNSNSQILVQSDKNNNQNSVPNNNIRNQNSNSSLDTNSQSVVSNKDSNSIEVENSKSLATQNKEIVFKDTANVLIAAVEINPLEQLRLNLAEEKNTEEKEEKINKWAVSTHATAVYFNSASEGSSLDNQFNENAKSYNSSLGYGVGLQYKLSKRMYLKTGISNLALSYNTNDVNYKTEFGSVSKNVATISRSKQGENIVLLNKNSRIETNDVENFNQNKNAVLNQKMGYIEVPVELNYKVIDKQISVFFVGGLSTLFLSSNSVSLIDNNKAITIGKANNLNPVHFSSNVGLGINYRIVKDFNFNFQPMFKYQLNSLNVNDNSFKPYYIGLNSGISYSF